MPAVYEMRLAEQPQFEPPIDSETMSNISAHNVLRRASRLAVVAVAALALAACASRGGDATSKPARTTAVVEASPSISGSALPEAQPGAHKHGELATGDPVCANLARIEKDAGQKFDGGMQFFELPGDGVDTSWHADGIRAFAQSGLPLLAVYEPHGDTTRLLDSTHQKQLKDYFVGLHEALSGADATFIIMPEPQAGESPDAWKAPTPAEYTKLMASLSKIIKQTNPNVKVAALLDLNGDDPAYAKELGTLPKGTFDTFILQAFANDLKIRVTGERVDLASYLDTKKALAYIQATGNLPTIINTGIPEVDKTAGASYGTADRAAIANALLNEAKALRAAGKTIVGVNLFAQNKLRVEGKSWDFDPAAARTVVGPFIQAANGIGLKVYGFSDNPA